MIWWDGYRIPRATASHILWPEDWNLSYCDDFGQVPMFSESDRDGWTYSVIPLAVFPYIFPINPLSLDSCHMLSLPTFDRC